MAYIDDEWYVEKFEGTEYKDGVLIVHRPEALYPAEVVHLPHAVFDALVLMRYAEMIEENGGTNTERATHMRQRALAVCDEHPCLGSEALRRMIGIPSLLPEPEALAR